MPSAVFAEVKISTHDDYFRLKRVNEDLPCERFGTNLCLFRCELDYQCVIDACLSKKFEFGV